MSTASSRDNWVAKLHLSRPYIFLILAYLAGLAAFASFRLLFLVSFVDRLEDATFFDILYAFGVGVRFDQIIVMAILAPLVLIIPWISLKFKAVRVFVVTYLTLLFSFCFLLLLGDIPFYEIIESRLNFLVFDYLTAGKTVWNLMLTEPRLWFFIALWLIATVLFVLVMIKLFRSTRNIPQRYSWSGQVVFMVLFIALAALGIRGRVGLASIKWGVAYFSQNHFVNQLGLNGVYTLSRVFTEEGGDNRLSYLPESGRFKFAPYRQAMDSVQAMLGQGDRWLKRDSSLKQLKTNDLYREFNPNVVIILMESWSARYTGCLGDRHGLTPNFDRLASEGILFANCYSSGIRSSYGMAATLCSYPSIPGRSVMTRYNALNPFTTLPEVLQKRGYFNGFAYGGDLVFDNLEGFFTTKGYDAFYGEEYFGTEHSFAKWGVPDHIVFDQVAKIVDTLPRPYNMTVFTLSNHEPFALPDSSVQKYYDDSDSSRVFNALVYADYALGRMFEEFRKKPSFDSTVFVLTSDHAHYAGSTLSIHPTNFHIPLLIYSPALIGKEPRVIDKVCSQVDLLPTLMGVLGGDYMYEGWGRDILDLPDSDSGFAVLNVLDRVGIMVPDYYYMEHIGQEGQLLDPEEIPERIRDISSEHPEVTERLKRQLHDYIQVAEMLSTPGMKVR